MSHAGARYFGVLSVTLPTRSQADYSWVVGIRNSHDQTYPAGLVAGTRVFVCDNLAFSGEVRISRKHTRFAMRDLRHLTARAVGQLGDRFLALDQWRHPAHETFRTRSLWSLFNAFTEVHKTGNPHTSLRRGEALHGLFDAVADLALDA